MKRFRLVHCPDDGPILNVGYHIEQQHRIFFWVWVCVSKVYRSEKEAQEVFMRMVANGGPHAIIATSGTRP